MRLSQSIDAGYDLDSPSVVKAKYRGAGPIRGNGAKCIDDAGPSVNNGTAIQLWDCNGTTAQSWAWNSGDGTLRVVGKCMAITGGVTTNGTQIQLWDCTKYRCFLGSLKSILLVPSLKASLKSSLTCPCRAVMNDAVATNSSKFSRLLFLESKFNMASIPRPLAIAVAPAPKRKSRRLTDQNIRLLYHSLEATLHLCFRPRPQGRQPHPRHTVVSLLAQQSQRSGNLYPEPFR